MVPRWASILWVHALADSNPSVHTFDNLNFVRDFFLPQKDLVSNSAAFLDRSVSTTHVFLPLLRNNLVLNCCPFFDCSRKSKWHIKYWKVIYLQWFLVTEFEKIDRAAWLLFSMGSDFLEMESGKFHFHVQISQLVF